MSALEWVEMLHDDSPATQNHKYLTNRPWSGSDPKRTSRYGALLYPQLNSMQSCAYGNCAVCAVASVQTPVHTGRHWRKATPMSQASPRNGFWQFSRETWKWQLRSRRHASPGRSDRYRVTALRRRADHAGTPRRPPAGRTDHSVPRSRETAVDVF